MVPDTFATASWTRVVLVLAMLMFTASGAEVPRTTVSSGHQLGFALPTWKQDGYEDPKIGTYFREIHDTGGRWVQLVPSFYQSSTTASDIRPTPQTPSDRGLVSSIAKAHEAGLDVLLKPVVDVTGAPGSQALIKPARPTDWFNNYRAFLFHYADIAAREDVDQFSVGNELAGTSGQRDQWMRTISGVRARYGGPLVYASNYDEYQNVSFWGALDLIGVDAYWPLSLTSTTDVAALRRAWDPISRQLAEFAGRQGKRVLFTEAGYTSVRGTTVLPYSWSIEDVSDPSEQAAAYEALLSEFEDQPWWAGVYWWTWNVVPDDGSDHSRDFNVRGKPAEKVVRLFWENG